MTKYMTRTIVTFEVDVCDRIDENGTPEGMDTLEYDREPSAMELRGKIILDIRPVEKLYRMPVEQFMKNAELVTKTKNEIEGE